MKKYCKFDIKQLFDQADAEGFAIPAFNYSDIWDMKALVTAAELERAPIMLMSDPPVYDVLGRKLCCAMADTLAEEASVPIIHHLDHSTDPAVCKQAIEYGFKSVMMDASDKALNENIRIVKDIVDFANRNDCFVEAEIGRIRGESSYETSYTGDDYLFILDEAVKLVEDASPDSLAIGIGNAHGFYEGPPEINFKKLGDAYEAINVPLVLHGGTGIPPEIVRKTIQGGIRKVNIGTDIYTTYMNAVRRKLMADGENQFTLEVMEAATAEVVNKARLWIRTCMADNKAL